jgi:Ca2+-binding RTX toxin-like protein
MSTLANKATWLAVLAVAVGLVSGFTSKDADAVISEPPPNHNVVACEANTVCNGTQGADVIAGAAGDEELRGVAGNDIYVGSAGNNDKYRDSSTSNDLYGGFRNDEFDLEVIIDKGGVDRVNLASTSAYASDDFEFFRGDFDADGVRDDLNISEANSGSDDIHVYDHFGTGRIEYVKFTDVTLEGTDLPLSRQ